METLGCDRLSQALSRRFFSLWIRRQSAAEFAVITVIARQFVALCRAHRFYLIPSRSSAIKTPGVESATAANEGDYE
jgi:hypothetical protein